MKSKVISTGYEPRPIQKVLHQQLKRFNVLVCHRRFGKTVFSINETIDKALRNDRKNPQYAYFAPYYGQAKRVAWDYLKDYTKNIPGATVNEAELRVDIKRADREDRVRIMLLGADNPAAIRGIYLDGVILDEYAEMDPTVWSQVIRPTLSDRFGWAIFIGTPKGMNHFHDLYQMASDNDKWFTAIYKASQTGIVHLGELEAAQIEMSYEEYQQEFECSFTAALVGSYYAKYLQDAEEEDRVRNVPYDTAVAVNTAWDLGIDDTTAIWFYQTLPTEFHFIDYLEDSGRGLEYYVKRVLAKEYIYGTHFLPHDAAARELGTGMTREEVIRKLGLRDTIVTQRQSVEDGINAVRMILPKSYFDSKKCRRGIDALKHYQRTWDAKNNIFSSKPKHDWSSHASDAFRYMALNSRLGQRQKNLPRDTNNIYDIFSYGV